MKKENFQTGKLGENLAVKYIQNKGYKIEERNFRTRFGEIDIVCWDAQTLVFVEVKTKIGHDFGEPEEMVNKSKISKVKRMGEIYVLNKNFQGQCRVDVVAIVLDKGQNIERIVHYQAVY